MKQTCLCEYLGAKCNHADTFLHIPASIRRRIYLYAGLTVGTMLPYPSVYEVEGDRNCRIPFEDFDVTFNLANVCTQIRTEVDEIVLSRNTCVYNTEETVDDGLKFLSHISPRKCSFLRDIYLHLDVRDFYYSTVESNSLKRERIEMWQWAATNILSNAAPGQLKLHLICDTLNDKKLAAVLKPLRNFPGVLLELELRLNMKFKDQVREIVLQAEGGDRARSGSFRFFDLPVEIRQHIYSYTNLVAPCRKVLWSPKSGFLVKFINCKCNGCVCLDEDLHADLKFKGCGACSIATGDFCMKHYASYSSRCSHGFSPLPLLLASRAMYNEAIAFFYASNRIVILPDLAPMTVDFARPDASLPTSQLGVTGQPNTIEEHYLAEQANDPMILDPNVPWPSKKKLMTYDATKRFMDKAGPTAPRLIRTLEIVFPRLRPQFSLSDRVPAHRDWCMATKHLAHIGTSGDVPKLTLIIHMYTTPPDVEPSWRHILEAEGTMLLKVLQPLSQLQLSRLFVHLDWTKHWSSPKLAHDIKTCKLPREESPGSGIGVHFIPRRNEDLAQLEGQLEKMVMGDEYDSYTVGKGDDLPSQWVRKLWNGIQWGGLVGPGAQWIWDD